MPTMWVILAVSIHLLFLSSLLAVCAQDYLCESMMFSVDTELPRFTTLSTCMDTIFSVSISPFL